MKVEWATKLWMQDVGMQSLNLKIINDGDSKVYFMWR